MHIHTSEQDRLELGFGNYTCNWGTHICGLYETEEERDEIIFGFLRHGDMAGDLRPQDYRFIAIGYPQA